MLVRYEQLDRTLDYVEREALGVGGALVNTLPFRRRRLVDGELVELDGFCGRRPRAAGHSRSAAPTSRPIASCSASRTSRTSATSTRSARRGKTTPARLVASRRDGDALVLEHELPGIRIETTIRAHAGLDRYRADERRRERGRRPPAACPRPLRRRRERGAGRERSSRSSAGRSGHRLRGRTGSSRRCRPRTRSAPSRSGRSSSSRRGIPEYEASTDGLRLTLLRCVGTISRPAGLPTRPLAAGPDIATPDGQCRGRHVFEYALRFDGDDLSNAALVRASQDYRTDFLRGDPFEPPLELGGDVVFSCLKQAEDGSGLVLRVFNPNPQPEPLTLNVPARRIRLDEEEAVDGGLELAPGEIATFLQYGD